jgi:predicted TIM-barrel fold metal-dependent hydrolase
MFINSHIHTLLFRKDVPKNFIPPFLTFLIEKIPFTEKLLRNILPSKNDILDRYMNFVDTGEMETQEDVFLECAKNYPSDTCFIIKSMDMKFMGAGKVKRDYPEQLIELKNLAKKYQGRIFPAIMLDPRRNKIFSLLIDAVERWGFKVAAIYPNLGYYPFDDMLHPCYEYCQRMKVPILAHASPFNPVHFRGSRKETLRLLGMTDIPFYSQKELCSFFAQPRNYIRLLQKYPTLNFCLAHAGSQYYWNKFLEDEKDGNWFCEEMEMIEKYPNLFIDISYTMSNKKYWPLLKVLLNESKYKNTRFHQAVLFGSDFYMVQIEGTEREWSINFRAFLGDELFFQIAEKNPKKYLYL